MSDNSKKYQTPGAKSPYIIQSIIDFSAHSGAVGVVALNTKIPAYADILNVDVFVETLLESGGSATVSIGVDDIATEPDNFLNDEAVASFAAANTVVNGVPRIGTATTKIAFSTSERQMAYEIKTAAITAGKLVVNITVLPVK